MSIVRALRLVTIGAGFIALAVTPHSIVAAGTTSCESLSSLVLPNTTITSSQAVAAAAGIAGTRGRTG